MRARTEELPFWAGTGLIPSDYCRQKLLPLLGSVCSGSRTGDPAGGVSSLVTEHFIHSDIHLLPVSNEISLSDCV